MGSGVRQNDERLSHPGVTNVLLTGTPDSIGPAVALNAAGFRMCVLCTSGMTTFYFSSLPSAFTSALIRFV
jgi:hypothetical protein